MHVGSYEITGEVGRGGAGTILRGRDSRLGGEAAIKILLEGREATPRQRTRFAREAEALRRLSHPNVVRLLEVGEHEGAPYMAMEFHPAGSLEASLRTELLSPYFVIRIGMQIASGLAAAHSLGVLHRDVKPDNVLIASTSKVLLTDFGLAKDLERQGQTQALTEAGAAQGTPGYWAPEQALGKPDQVGPATDVYGLGATLYAALTGRPPIVGEGFLEILSATGLQRPPSPRSLRPEVPIDLERVVMRCLEKEPTARWASATELKEALALCLDSPPAPQQSRKGVGLLVGAAVLCVLLAVGVGTALKSPALAAPSVTQSPVSLVREPSPLQAASSPPASSPPASSPPAAPSPPASQTSPSEAEAASSEFYRKGEAELSAERFPEALVLFTLGAEAGELDAFCRLGDMHLAGQGVPVNEERAAEWYRKAAWKTHPESMFKLALLLAEGRGVRQDEEMAVRYLRRASEHELSGAIFALSRMVESGRGCSANHMDARNLCRRAAELGDPEAMYQEGEDSPDDMIATTWYRRAADKGHLKATVRWAERALTMTVVLQGDRELALYRLREAARLGEVEAMTILSYHLGTGHFVPKDEVEARMWCRLAAERGDAGSMWLLGHDYEEGRGVAKSREWALELYRRAVKGGYELAASDLKRLEAEGVEKSRGD